MRRILGAVLCASLLLGASSAFAVTGDVTATANVLTPISVTDDLRSLDFGDVFPGINKSVAYDDATSGKWRVNGEVGKEVQMSLTLPANLVNGGDTLPISFGAADAAWHASDDVLAATVFDPSGGLTQLLDGATGELYLWLGGQVAPWESQPAGVYTATAILDVVYTGN